ncbi:MAG: Thiol-disulfide oxidoreductase ResA [Bacteroidota bacterium]|jgi:peroxiredoxin
MKNIFLALFTSSVLFFFACKNQPISSSLPLGHAVLVCKINAPQGNQITVQNDLDKVTDSLGPKMMRKFVLNLDECAYYNILHGDQGLRIFLKPNDSLYVYLDMNSVLDSTRITGKGNEESNYLLQKASIINQMYANYQSLFQKKEIEFVAELNANRTTMEQTLETYRAAHPTLSPKFVAYEKQAIRYDWAQSRMGYPEYHQQLNNEAAVLSPSYDDYLKELNLNDDTLLVVNEYKNFILNNLYKKVGEAIQTDSSLQRLENGVFVGQFRWIPKLYNSRGIQEFCSFHTLKEMIDFQGAEASAAEINAFNGAVENNAYKAEIGTSVQKWQHLAHGKPAPILYFNNEDSTQVSLENLRGSTLYLYFWTSEHPQCLQELSRIEQAKKYLNDPKVLTFVGFCMDKDNKTLKKMRRQGLSNIQVWLNPAQQTLFAKAYHLTDVPRAVLIGPDGRIENAVAPKPSSRGFVGFIKGLKK